MQANQILDLGPGEVFVQRNVGNLATHKDLNCMACLEYSVDALKVKHVMVVGHYNCGTLPFRAFPWPSAEANFGDMRYFLQAGEPEHRHAISVSHTLNRMLETWCCDKPSAVREVPEMRC